MNVKVGAHDGAVDVSQVIAAIDWVVQHRNDNGLNIRVINLSYGTNSTQPYQVDPLAYAVEQAWKAGIVVVAAAGNSGYEKGASAQGSCQAWVWCRVVAANWIAASSTGYSASNQSHACSKLASFSGVTSA